MEFRLLGPLEVRSEEGVLELGGPKQRLLLALLLLEANRVVATDRLIDALWDGRPPATAAKALQVYVSQLRRLLGRDRLETKPPGYRLRTERGELDCDRFWRLRDEGKFAEALSLWQGEPLADFRYRSFAQVEIARLEDARLACLEGRIEADLTAGRHRELVGELEALVVEHPLRQRLRAQLMLALYRSGRDAEALDVYRTTRRVLVDELGIEPRRELRELEQAILRQDPVLDFAPTAVEAGRGVFVGRQAELELLATGLDDAIAGRGRLFLLVGEPGIGKSRLAEELIRVARARSVEVLVGRCWEAGGAPAYWPWVQSLRGHAAEAPPELQTLLRRDGASSDSESARFRLFDATAEFLARVSRRQPLLLFLDDMHAADEPSLLLLRFLAREIAGTRTLIVVACRDVDPVPGRPLASMLAETVREAGTTRLSLRGLTRGDVGEYVAATAAALDSPEIVETLYADTQGNPLFVGESVRLLLLEGGGTLPPSLRDVIARRLLHLSDECNRVLVLAAVLGREFDHAALAAFARVSLDQLLESLDEAMTARILTDVPEAPTRSRFAHVLIRDALYDGLTSARRVRLHRAAVELLERLGGDDAELAYHAINGNELEKALLCARRAGDGALALLAFEEAARLYDVALGAGPDESTRCELLLSRGDAETRAGKSPAAQATFLHAAEIARALGDAHALARAAAGYGGRIVWSRAGDDERLVPILEEGLAALGDGDAELRARLLARLAGALRDEPSRDRREEISGRAVELARASGNQAALAYALVGHAHAITAPDTIDEMHATATELSEVAAAIGDLERIEAAHLLRFMCEHWRGDRDRMEEDLAAVAEIAERLKQPIHLWELAGARTMLALADGRFDEAESLAEQAFALGRQAIPDQARSHYLMHRYALREFRGGLDSLASEVTELARQQSARPVFAAAEAHLLATLGRDVQARRVLTGLVEALPFDQEWLFGMSLIGEAAALVAADDVAAAAYDALTPWGELNAADQSEGSRGALARTLGQLAARLDRPEQAAEHFDFALAMNERMGYRPWLARTQDDYARLLRSRLHDESAAALEAAALAEYDRLGINRAWRTPA